MSPVTVTHRWGRHTDAAVTGCWVTRGQFLQPHGYKAGNERKSRTPPARTRCRSVSCPGHAGGPRAARAFQAPRARTALGTRTRSLAAPADRRPTTSYRRTGRSVRVRNIPVSAPRQPHCCRIQPPAPEPALRCPIWAGQIPTVQTYFAEITSANPRSIRRAEARREKMARHRRSPPPTSPTRSPAWDKTQQRLLSLDEIYRKPSFSNRTIANRSQP